MNKPVVSDAAVQGRFNLVVQLAEMDYVRARNHSPLAYAATKENSLLSLFAITSPLSLALIKGATLSFNQHGAPFKESLSALNLGDVEMAMERALATDSFPHKTCLPQLTAMKNAVTKQRKIENA